MTLTLHSILLVVALILSIVALIKPQWPLCAVAVLLVCVALLAGR